MSDDSPERIPGAPAPGGEHRLLSWKEIRAYLGCDARTAQRWEKSEGLPVHRHVHSKGSSIYAYAKELDTWRETRRSRPSGTDEATVVTEPGTGFRIYFRIAVAAATALVLIGGAIFWTRRARGSQPNGIELPKPLTTWLGTQTVPSFSPDGNSLAFTWNGEHQDNFDIYVLTIGGNSPMRLTRGPEADYSPAWSPDGKTIAFLRCPVKGTADVILAAASGGGQERALAGLSTRQAVQSRDIDWSPDGRWLAVTDAVAPGASLNAIVAISTESGATRVIAKPGPGESYAQPAISPDARTLAFVCTSAQGGGNFCLMPLTGDGASAGAVQAIRIRGFENSGLSLFPRWTADGRDLIFSSMRFGVNRLWRASRDGGEPQMLPGVGERVNAPAVARKMHRLAYSQRLYNTSIWSVYTRSESSSPTRVITSTHPDLDPQYSPDGRKIAFVSERTGIAEIWSSDRDGSNPRQITNLKLLLTGEPRWSPDGTQIAFDSSDQGHSQIYVVDTNGGEPQRAIQDRSVTVLPAWSPDGQWLYFCSDRSGDLQLWRMPLKGGASEQVTRAGGFASAFSPDGAWLYFTKPSVASNERPAVDLDRHGIARSIRTDTTLWKMPAKGGAEVLVAEGVRDRCFAPVRDGVYVIQRSGEGRQIVFYPSNGTRESRIAAVPQTPLPGLSASPDGGSVLYTAIEQNNWNLMLLENFR